ncbi:MAG: tetratricopeptide repeat protein [Polyangiaceae bacterium]
MHPYSDCSASPKRGREDLDSAITTLNEALRLEPKNYAVAVNLARTLRERGHLDEAITWFERAVELEPRAADGFSMLSNARREAGHIDAAIDAARRALDVNPRHVEAHLNHGAALQAADVPDDACTSYLVAQLLSPRDPRVRNNLSSLLKSASATSHVATWIRRLQANPADTAANDALIARELDEARSASALVLLEHRIARKAEPSPLRKLALLLWERGSRSEATEYLRRALELDPKDVKSLRLLGSWYSGLGDGEAAEGYLRQVLTLTPEDVVSKINLGATLIRQGRPVEATRVLTEAVATWPDRIEGLINLGTALSDQGRFSEARAIYQRGLRIRPAQKDLDLEPALLDALRSDRHTGRPVRSAHRARQSHRAGDHAVRPLAIEARGSSPSPPHRARIARFPRTPRRLPARTLLA